jgi:hypothetical protein
MIAATFGLLSVAGSFRSEATLGTKLALTMHLILTAAIVGAIVVRDRMRSEP